MTTTMESLYNVLYISCRFNQCYGVLGILDYLHGTDVSFRKGKSYERHVVLTGFTPANQLHPDEKRY